ncbi:type II toxin-antitoxin system RelE/ParE family toxin [Actinomycetota bacterium]
MPYIIKYHKTLKEDLNELDEFSRSRIRKAIEARLLIDPLKYGQLLKGTLKGFRILRIGGYRVVYKIVKKEIIILGVRHRKDIYEIIASRGEINKR